MKTYDGMEAKVHTFLTSALNEDEWPAARSSHIISGETAPVPIGYEAGLTTKPIWRGKILVHLPGTGHEIK
jgi:hypothetical protein